DDLRGMLSNLAFSFSLYSGQMCTAPQNVYVPADGIDTDEGHLSFEELAGRLAEAVSAFNADDKRAVEILGAIVNDDVRGRATDVPALARQLGGEVVLDSRPVTHPVFPDATVRVPALISVDAGNEAAYTQECFGPVALVIRTGSTQESLDRLARTVAEHGGMTASVYSTSEEVLGQAREAAASGGVALSENL